jgi:hypothetical protein
MDHEQACEAIARAMIEQPSFLAYDPDRDRAHRLDLARAVATVQHYRPRRGGEWIHQFWTGHLDPS